MRRFLIILLIFISAASPVFAAKIPEDVKNIVKKDFPKADFRFDGVIILPNQTIYLPLYPALVKKNEDIKIKTTYPENTPMAKMPDIVIFDNDYVLMKVLNTNDGKKTVLYQANPPIEVKTGLLPQDMLVPRGLSIPDNIKGIIGNLEIATIEDKGLRVESDLSSPIKPVAIKTTADLFSGNLPQLKNKTLYIATCYSKNIHVVNGENREPDYALSQKAVPIDMKAVGDDKFLLVTTFAKSYVNVISLADEAVIKQIELATQPNEIIIDEKNKKAYISSSEASCIYVIDLETMLLKQKIKINGMCERLVLCDDAKKLIYFDKKSNEVFCVELDNDYKITDIGMFPNVSKIAFEGNKVYLTSRTKNRLAIIDYATLCLIKEIPVAAKPIDMYAYNDNLYILGAEENVVQVLDIVSDSITDTVYLNTHGFSTKIYPLKSTNLAIITDTKAGKYSIFDFDKNKVIKTNQLDIPVSTIAVTEKVKKINK